MTMNSASRVKAGPIHALCGESYSPGNTIAEEFRNLVNPGKDLKCYRKLLPHGIRLTMICGVPAFETMSHQRFTNEQQDYVDKFYAGEIGMPIDDFPDAPSGSDDDEEAMGCEKPDIVHKASRLTPVPILAPVSLSSGSSGDESPIRSRISVSAQNKSRLSKSSGVFKVQSRYAVTVPDRLKRSHKRAVKQRDSGVEQGARSTIGKSSKNKRKRYKDLFSDVASSIQNLDCEFKLGDCLVGINGKKTKHKVDSGAVVGNDIETCAMEWVLLSLKYTTSWCLRKKPLVALYRNWLNKNYPSHGKSAPELLSDIMNAFQQHCRQEGKILPAEIEKGNLLLHAKLGKRAGKLFHLEFPGQVIAEPFSK